MARMVGVEQDSPLWVISRVGCVTASRVDDVCKKLKKADREAAAREAYRMEKIIETLTGRAANHPVNEAMYWGRDRQAMNKTEYELRHEVFCDPGGFWMHDKIAKFRGSPDYLIGKDGLLECKCPFYSENHLETLMKREVPERYLWQIQSQLALTRREWCDFASFDPRLPENLQLVVIRVPRDEALIAAIEVEVVQFIEEVEQAVKFMGAESKAPADVDKEVVRKIDLNIKGLRSTVA